MEGGGRGGGKAARSKPSSEKLLATTVTIYRVFISRSVDGSSSPQGYSGLPSSFSPIHALILFYSAHQRKCSLFPDCNSLFLFHPRQYLEDLCPHPLLSDAEVKHMDSISPGGELLEKPGVPCSESCPQPASTSSLGRGRVKQLTWVCPSAQPGATQS